MRRAESGGWGGSTDPARRGRHLPPLGGSMRCGQRSGCCGYRLRKLAPVVKLIAASEFGKNFAGARGAAFDRSCRDAMAPCGVAVGKAMPTQICQNLPDVL